MTPQDLDLIRSLDVAQAWIPLAIMAASAIAGALAKNKQKNRETQNAANVNNDQLDLSQYAIQQRALLDALEAQERGTLGRGALDLNQRQHQQQQREFNLNAGGTRGRQAVFGSMLQNMQPVSLSGLTPQLRAKMPQFSGGLTPAALSPEAREMGALLVQQALQGQQTPGVIDQFSALPMPNFQSAMLPPPQRRGYEQAGKVESILGLLGAAGNAYGAYGGGGTNPNRYLPSSAGPGYGNYVPYLPPATRNV